LAVTLAECTFGTGGVGLSVDLPGVEAGEAGEAWTAAATLFSESASRVILSVAPERAAAFQQRAKDFDVAARHIGTTGTSRIVVLINGRSVIDLGVDEAEAIWDTALEQHFKRRAA
jgi:phosphoribosylformylglycinamidine (FGAM) synthase-like enzyme